ncbi:MAG TPA: hypothetical protein VG722_12670 [Tepidisphaeraceae bacterium]|nr:hypothetical protein [Tepidisphaeraceae bacterium]
MKSAESSHVEYTPQQIDRLAFNQCETVVAAPGSVMAYDVEFYDRVERRKLLAHAPDYFNPSAKRRRRVPAQILTKHVANSRYLLRLGGFRRDTVFGPDAAASEIAAAGIQYADSIGNGLFEHLLLCRKHGIIPAFEAPAMEMPLPFLDREMVVFAKMYRRHIEEMRDCLLLAEKIYGHKIVNRPGQPWTLWLAISPLALFLTSMQRNPRETSGELKSAAGICRLDASVRTPKDRARQAGAWRFIRRQHMRILKIMSETLRDMVAADGLIVGNMHTLPPVDYELMGEAFDLPGLAVRPGYVKDPWLREPYVGYAVRLFSDLCNRRPLVSIRANITAAGTYCVAGKNAISAWYDEALRLGAGGFYVWPVDYPMGGVGYRGAMAGNPDASLRGPERWESLLKNCQALASRRQFTPPVAEVGILVPYDVLDRDGWKKIMETFIELRTARIWSRLIPARAAEREESALFHLKLLIIPCLPLASGELINRLNQHVRSGGTVAIPSLPVGIHDLDGAVQPGLCGLTREDASSPEHMFGSGRVVLPPEPTMGRAIQFTDRSYHLSRTAAHWKKIAAKSMLNDLSWIFEITADDLPPADPASDVAPPPDPAVRLRHYMYEHSSDWIFPHLQNAPTFPHDIEQ